MQRLIGVFSVLLLIAVTAFAQETATPAAGGKDEAGSVDANPFKSEEKAASPGGEKDRSAADRPAILALLARLETGFASGDAKGLAACWTEDGEFVGPAGERADGREGLEKQFAEAFAARKTPGKLQLRMDHLRVVNKGLALVEAVAEVKPPVAGGAPTTAFVLVKQGDQWLIESARETIAHLPSQANHLKELAWLAGDWASEPSKDGVALHSTCDWTANQAFLIRKFKVEGKGAFLHGGTEIIGWDPRTDRIRSWLFDSDGGFGESVWVHDGNRWLVKFSGTLADGSEASATHVLASVDAGTTTMQSKDRIVNGTAQPDVPELVLKRQAETKPAEAKKPEK